jgi:hypothetical protein
MCLKIKLICRLDRQNKNNTAPLFLRFTKDNKIKYKSLGITIPVYSWDNANNKLFDNYPSFLKHQHIINSKIVEYQKIVKRLELLDVDVTLATRAQLSSAFQIPERSISRWLVEFKKAGEKNFYVKKKVVRARIFTEEVKNKIATLRLSGHSIGEICEELSILKNTFQKALLQNRLSLPPLPVESACTSISTKSSRSVPDNASGMGKSCTHELSRVPACSAGMPAPSIFGNHFDLSYGGLLLTMPSLPACGLLRHISRFECVSGYYTATQVFISLAFLMLLRISRLEQTDTVPAGELGRCMGLDRIPEVKTLRKRIDRFCRVTDVEEWPESEFTDREVITPSGEKEMMQLAERQTVLYGKKEKGEKQKEVTVREIRKKTTSGHQTALITTNRIMAMVKIALLMFAGWGQEIFFKYMVESFGIDSITSYFKNLIPDMSPVVNPQYRELDRQHKRITTLINNRKLKYAAISLQNKEMSKKEIERYAKKKSDMQFEIEDLEEQRTAITVEKNRVDKKIFHRHH